MCNKSKKIIRFQVFIIFAFGIIFFGGSVSLAYGQEFENDQINVEVVADNLEIPWSIAFSVYLTTLL